MVENFEQNQALVVELNFTWFFGPLMAANIGLLADLAKNYGDFWIF